MFYNLISQQFVNLCVILFVVLVKNKTSKPHFLALKKADTVYFCTQKFASIPFSSEICAKALKETNAIVLKP